MGKDKEKRKEKKGRRVYVMILLGLEGLAIATQTMLHNVSLSV